MALPFSEEFKLSVAFFISGSGKERSELYE
jgi:hypothetical protein